MVLQTGKGIRYPESTDHSRLWEHIESAAEDVDSRIGRTLCTSSTRPASPYTGQLILETDTGKSMIYNGTTWLIDAGRAVVTSSTRPANPSKGTLIYETDTNNTYIWDGSNWLADGGFHVCTSSTRPSHARPGTMIFETNTGNTYVWNAGLSLWSALEVDGTWTPVWSNSGGTAPSLGNGSITGRYHATGNYYHCSLELDAGSTTNFGTGTSNWRFTTPPVAGTVYGLHGYGFGYPQNNGAGNSQSVTLMCSAFDGSHMQVNVASQPFNDNGTSNQGGILGPQAPAAWIAGAGTSLHMIFDFWTTP